VLGQQQVGIVQVVDDVSFDHLEAQFPVCEDAAFACDPLVRLGCNDDGL
jgi:hypothetical protein